MNHVLSKTNIHIYLFLKSILFKPWDSPFLFILCNSMCLFHGTHLFHLEFLIIIRRFILLHGYHLTYCYLSFSILYIKTFLSKIQCRHRIELESYAANSNNRFSTQTVAHINLQTFPAHRIIFIFFVPSTDFVDFSLRSYSCVADEASDVDSICSCDSSFAIGPRPPS